MYQLKWSIFVCTVSNEYTQLVSSQLNLRSHMRHQRHCGTCWSHGQCDHQHGSNPSTATCMVICHTSDNDTQQNSLSTQVHRLWHHRSDSLSRNKYNMFQQTNGRNSKITRTHLACVNLLNYIDTLIEYTFIHSNLWQQTLENNMTTKTWHNTMSNI